METIIFKQQDRIASLILNRPEKRNAFNNIMVKELKEAFAEIEKNEQIRVVLLKARGPVFSAGADLSYLEMLQGNTFEENLIDSQNLKELFYLIYTYPKPVIAQVEGAAIAGGCGLATVCDFCYAVPEATFGYTEVKIGFIPALVSVFLSRKIGEGKARQYLMSGEKIPAEEALTSGLINGLFSKENISEKVEELAKRLSLTTSPAALSLTKQLLAASSGLPMEEALGLAAKYNAEARATPDCKKGISSFLAKEKIKW